MNTVYRYDSVVEVVSQLDPIEDIMSWVESLQSAGYASDVLRIIHGIRGTKEIKKASIEIGALSRSAVGLIQQAYSGPPEISYLPLILCNP